jgi:dTDP-4-dehydrorhamnose 3,5-epimerase-like enzyme
VALEDDTTVSYLVSSSYAPAHEHAISPVDPALAIDFPLPLTDLVISEKDSAAPTLAEALEQGILPRWEG